MKKNMMKSAFAALALSAVAVSATSVSAFAVTGYTSNGTGANSEVKPTVTISHETISLDEAKANPKRTVKISVSGAAGKYAPTGLHIDYDQRLTLKNNDDGDPATLQQSALKISECVTDGTHGLFLTTGAKSDAGKDGDLWTFDVELPSDVKAGDKFPITFWYKAKDLFTNVSDDANGKAMQDYVFTSGLVDGYIEIEAPIPTTTTTTSTTTTTTTTTTTSTTTTTTTTTTGTGTTPAVSSTAAASGKTPASTTKKAAAKTTAKKGDSPKTGVAGAGVAVAGLAVAVATAFALRKKED